MNSPLSLALAGAGLIGRRHAEIVRMLGEEVTLASIVDPSEAGRAFAEGLGVAWFPSLSELFAVSRPDGAILATPNQVHVDNGLECVDAGCPMLVEKPIATTCAEAKKLLDAAEAADIPILVGHHRRHNPLMQKARALIEEGRLGQITSVQGTCWFLKPEDYFEPEWRRQEGAGPVMVNAIHDIDLLRYLCGDVDSVQALTANAVRGFEPEDTAAILLRFKSGALGTFNLSDTVASPWSWELTAGENPAYAFTPQSCYAIGGTKASLSIPDMQLWEHGDGGHWKTSISATSFTGHDNTDPLIAQIRHFANVIHGRELPLVSGKEASLSLGVLEAIKQSAASGEMVRL